jgi:hypothetical protein
VAARALGMGRPDGLVTASFRRTLDRVISFGFARLSCGRIDAIGENDSLSVRRRLPGLTSRQLERLPRALRDDHDSWCASQPTDEVIRSKVQRLAHSLLQLGEPPQAVEQHLLRLDFHPNVVHTGVRHALDRLARAEPACSDDAA